MIIDLTPEVSERLAVFPGDTPYRNESLLSIGPDSAYALSKITTTPHLGAHVDAPSHYHASGVPIGRVELSPYVGLAQVIEVPLKGGERILRKHLAGRKIQAPRVLFKTGSYPDPLVWTEFAALSPEVIEILAEAGVILVGIDTPSVDLADDPNLLTHQKLFEKKIANLEGIILSGAREGLYTLVALPLKLADCDASPVRAVLLPETWSGIGAKR